MVLGSHQAPALFIYESVPLGCGSSSWVGCRSLSTATRGKMRWPAQFHGIGGAACVPFSPEAPSTDDDIQFDNTVLVYLLLPGSAVLPFVS